MSVRGRYPPDDPRVAALADELAQARGESPPWLLWSGRLADDGDEATAARALLQKRWWLFNGDTELEEVEEGPATDLLMWLFGHTLAYRTERMPPARASAFAARLLSLLPGRRRWFTNGEETPPNRSNVYSSTPSTDHTFDLGVVAVANDRAWIAWFTDED